MKTKQEVKWIRVSRWNISAALAPTCLATTIILFSRFSAFFFDRTSGNFGNLYKNGQSRWQGKSTPQIDSQAIPPQQEVRQGALSPEFPTMQAYLANFPICVSSVFLLTIIMSTEEHSETNRINKMAGCLQEELSSLHFSRAPTPSSTEMHLNSDNLNPTR